MGIMSDIVYLVLVPFSYQGLLSISYIIHDPFGDDMLDFPVMAYTEYVKDTCSALDLAQKSCPALEASKSAHVNLPSDANFSVESRECFARIRGEKAAAKAKAAPAPAPAPAAPPAFTLPGTAGEKFNASVEKMVQQVTSTQNEMRSFLREEYEKAKHLNT
jgi:hypothetical protein